MDWEQKLQALNTIGQCKLIMRQPGNWYVSQGIDVKNKHVLEGHYGNGSTPQAAVEDHWQKLTDLASHEYIVGREGGVGERCAVRWSGFMWDRVDEAPRVAAAQ